MKHICIIGNGIAGTTVARHLRKLGNLTDRITIVSSETKHFYSRPSLMYIYMGHLTYEQTKPYEDYFWKKNKIDLLHDFVLKVDFDNKKLHLQQAGVVAYDVLVLATGSKSRQLGLNGEDAKGVQSLYNYQDLQLMTKKTQGISDAIVVGGGLIGVEMVEMLLSQNIKTTFLVRSKNYWQDVLPQEEAEMVDKEIKQHGVNLLLSTQIKYIEINQNQHVESIVTTKGDVLPAQFLGLAIGVVPNIDFLKGTKLAINKGVLANEYLETNIPDVYAVGDCAELTKVQWGRRAIEPIWYIGKIQGEYLARTLCKGKTPYNAGVWFNSAKFFDITYQTYGVVPSQCPEGVESLYWQDKATNKKCLRINFNKSTGKLLGFNFLGIQGRHQVAESWILQGQTIQYALKNLKQINFDPEFFKPFHKNFIATHKQYLS